MTKKQQPKQQPRQQEAQVEFTTEEMTHILAAVVRDMARYAEDPEPDQRVQRSLVTLNHIAVLIASAVGMSVAELASFAFQCAGPLPEGSVERIEKTWSA